MSPYLYVVMGLPTWMSVTVPGCSTLSSLFRGAPCFGIISSALFLCWKQWAFLALVFSSCVHELCIRQRVNSFVHCFWVVSLPPSAPEIDPEMADTRHNLQDSVSLWLSEDLVNCSWPWMLRAVDFYWLYWFCCNVHAYLYVCIILVTMCMWREEIDIGCHPLSSSVRTWTCTLRPDLMAWFRPCPTPTPRPQQRAKKQSFGWQLST